MTDFARTKSLFHLPEGVVYLDGNSLGPLPLAARDRVARLLSDEWGEMLIRGWSEAGWMDAPARIGDRVGRLIGAAPGTVVMGDTLSIKVYQALAAALELRPGRQVVLSDYGNFPSDLHMAKGLMHSLGRGHELRLVAPEAVAEALDESVAVLMLTEVDYRTGRLHDMAGLTGAAHAAGALTVWDLSHSAGALPIDLEAAGADLAVGSTYKFLNGGPGAPAFIYVASRHIERVRPALCGWLGHEAPFAFDLDYRPGPGIARMRIGTPSILGLAALDAALDAWEGVSIEDVRARVGGALRALHQGSRAALPGARAGEPPERARAGLAGIVALRGRLSLHAGAYRPGRHRRLSPPGRDALRDRSALSRRRRHRSGRRRHGGRACGTELGPAAVSPDEGGDLTRPPATGPLSFGNYIEKCRRSAGSRTFRHYSI